MEKKKKGYIALICDDCDTEIFRDLNMVVLKDELWNSIADKHEDAYCDCCIEKRLKRPITLQDFKVSTQNMGGMVLCNALWLEEMNKKGKVVSPSPDTELNSPATRAKALEWWNNFSDKEKLDLSLKHYNVLDLSVKQVIFVWRRITGGEWTSLL